jgi:hypothetical protein
MRIGLAAIVLGLVLLAGLYWWHSSRGGRQVAFCPATHQTTTATALKESASQRNGVTQALRGPELENSILLVADDLKRKYPTADTAEIVNYLLTAYCPIVAGDTGLSQSERRARMDRFSSQVDQIIRHRQ